MKKGIKDKISELAHLQIANELIGKLQQENEQLKERLLLKVVMSLMMGRNN